MFNAQSNSSKDVAKDRLKNMLMRDRVDVAPGVLKQLKDDIISDVSEYFTVRKRSSEVYLTNSKRPLGEGCETVLVCLVPISKLKENE